jgi:hypothetical protein
MVIAFFKLRKPFNRGREGLDWFCEKPIARRAELCEGAGRTNHLDPGGSGVWDKGGEMERERCGFWGLLPNSNSPTGIEMASAQQQSHGRPKRATRLIACLYSNHSRSLLLSYFHAKKAHSGAERELAALAR